MRGAWAEQRQEEEKHRVGEEVWEGHKARRIYCKCHGAGSGWGSEYHPQHPPNLSQHPSSGAWVAILSYHCLETRQRGE